MKYLVSLLALIYVLPLAAQKPDNDAIEFEVSDPGSRYYYPNLMLRYQAGDSTLDFQDYYHLYYGYAFQEEYKPLESITEEGMIMMVFERAEQFTEEDCRTVIALGEKVMERDPFSPRNLNFLTYAYGSLGDNEMELVYATHLKNILDVIDSSGDGLRENSPWHVLGFSHVTDFLGARGLYPIKRTVVSRTVEYVELLEKDGRTRGYYFDFGRMYWKEPENMPERPREGLQFKNMQPSYRVR